MQSATIIVGAGTTAKGNAINSPSRAHMLSYAKRLACELFGGYTVHKSNGGWTDDTGTLVEETGYVFTILITPDNAERLPEYARFVRSTFDQTSVVLIGPNGRARFIEAEP